MPNPALTPTQDVVQYIKSNISPALRFRLYLVAFLSGAWRRWRKTPAASTSPGR